ncbi:MAG: hypothetical protein K2X29_02800, partial [Candidatus Obscuribacterales bacterium]|nr:hypothetical protein [Candidatus Obscuribacterales bacterium]
MSDIAKNPKPSSAEKSNNSRRTDADEKEKRASQDLAEGAHSKLHAEAYKPTEKKPSKPEEKNGGATEKRLQDAVTQVHDALHQKAWGGLGGPEPNVGKILNMLGTLSEPDQKRFEKLYNEKYKNEKRTFGSDLNDAFPDKNSADLQQIKNVLERPHNVADVAGQLQWATKGLTDGKHDKQAMEKVILDAVSMCTRKELEQLNMESSLKGNTNLSESARKALNLLFKGKDVIYDKDGHMKDSYVHVLSNLALSSHPPRLDLYKHALQSATTSCREAIKNQDGEHEIDRAFSAQDARVAKDYLNEGRVSLVTQIAEDHKDILGIPVWNGKEDVARSMEEASHTADSAKYEKGEKLASQYKLGEYLVKQGNSHPNRPELQEAVKTYQALQEKGNATAEDRKAFKFYTELNHELHKVGNDREVKDWEAQLLGSESLISQLAKAHSDLSMTSLPGHKRDDLYKAVENLSKKDWEQFRNHPEDIARVASTLGTFAEEDRARLTEMLREKVNANNKNWTYEQSKKVGHRSIGEVGEQNKPNPIAETLQFHDTEKAANKIDAFMHLTDAERLAWRDKNSAVHKRIEDMTHSLKPGLEQDLAKRVLDKVQNNKPFDAVDKIMLADLKGEQNDIRKTVKDLETAYKENPELLKDQQIKKYFEKVLNNAVDKSGLGTIISQGYVRASRYDEFAGPLFKTGHVPLDLKAQIATSKQQHLEAIKEATADELKRLQADHPDPATKAFQDKVLGTATEDRTLLLEIAKESAQKTSAQGRPESLANECRAFALGYGDKNPGELVKKVKDLSDAQKQVLANEYYRLYGKQIADDVIQHTPESQRRVTRESFSEFPVSSKQSVLNADANRAERREGRLDGTKQAADESVEAL